MNFEPGTRVRYVPKGGEREASIVFGTVHESPGSFVRDRDGTPYVYVLWDYFPRSNAGGFLAGYPPQTLEAVSVIELLAELA